MAEKILDNKELEFYKWDGQLPQLLQNVRDKLNKVSEVIPWHSSSELFIYETRSVNGLRYYIYK